MKPETRLKELSEELLKGRVVETRIRAAGEHVEGLTESTGMIYLDPRSSIISTLLHELLHRRYPSWSERRVRQEEARLVANMTPADISRWYRQYQKIKTIRRKPKEADS